MVVDPPPPHVSGKNVALILGRVGAGPASTDGPHQLLPTAIKHQQQQQQQQQQQ